MLMIRQGTQDNRNKNKARRREREREREREGRRLNGFLRLSLNDGTILFLVILLDKTVSVG